MKRSLPTKFLAPSEDDIKTKLIPIITMLFLVVSLLAGCAEPESVPTPAITSIHLPPSIPIVSRTPRNTSTADPNIPATETLDIFNQPIQTVTSILITHTPTDYIYPFPLLNTPVPSIYQMDPTQFSEYRFESLCLDNVTRIENLPGRRYDVPEENFNQNNGLFFRTDNDFDPNTYFNILTHIHMEQGYSLDFLYAGEYQFGRAELYARPVGGYRINNIQDFMEYTGESNWNDAWDTMFYFGDDYPEYIILDNSPTSFFQFALLSLVGQDFYNRGNEGSGQRMVFCGRYDLERLLEYFHEFPEELHYEVEALDLAPTLMMGSEVVEVRLVYFFYWSGIIEQIYWFDRNFPHILLDRQERNLLPFTVFDFFPSP